MAPVLASAARCAVGCRKRLTSGCVPAGIFGTPSTRAAFALLAYTSGQRRRVSRVTAGRHIRIGMSTDEASGRVRLTRGRCGDLWRGASRQPVLGVLTEWEWMHWGYWRVIEGYDSGGWDAVDKN